MSHSDPVPAEKGHRLWFLIAVAALAAVGIAVIPWLQMERNYQAWLSAGIVLLSVLLVMIWFFLLSRFSWRVRLGGLLALTVLVFEMSRLVRVDGTMDGRGLPKFAWRWNVKHRALPAAISPGSGPLSVAPAAGEADAPQFFGPNRDGVVRGANLARDWKVNPPKELWRKPVGAGWSAFAVVGGRAFTQEQRGEEEAVTCYELLTGRPVWMHTYRARFFQWQGGEGPRATPTVNGGQVFTFGATGILICLDAATGQSQWSRDVLQENHLQNLEWGVSASPLIVGDAVIVTGGATNGPTILAYARATGEPLWKAGSDKASYASPILATLAGQRVVLSVNASTITAHDPATGAVRLDFRWTDDKWPKGSQPVILPDNRIFVSAGYGMGALLLQVKAETDGGLSAEPLWKSVRMKTQFNSVGVRDGLLYGLDDGLLACVDGTTGERLWKDGRYGSGQTLLVDDVVIVQSEPGPVILAAARPEGFKELGRIPALSSKTWNHPTLAGRYLLLRNDREAVCYELATEGK